jgi:hypothetical protein
MPVHPGPRLQKVTLNLYWADMRQLEAKPEWTVWIRNLVHEALARERRIGDYDE